MRKALSLFLGILFICSNMAGYASPDPKALLQTVWKAQTIEELNNGVWILPEEALNQYFSSIAISDNVRNPNLRLLGDNRMLLAFDSKVGRVRLTCEVKQFVHNQTESYAEVFVRKKEVVDKPFISWMLKYISLGAIADLYGNPLKETKQVNARFNGNTLTINFRPIVEKSLLNHSFGKQIEISRITIREGAILLHTNMKAETILTGLLNTPQQ